jgi:hypothetical protein
MINFFILLLAQEGQYTDLEEFFSLAVGFFAIFLLAISLRAYKRTHLKKLLLVSAAFGLFAVKTFLNHLDLLIPTLDSQFVDFFLTVIDFFILLLFFLALVKKT